MLYISLILHQNLINFPWNFVLNSFVVEITILYIRMLLITRHNWHMKTNLQTHTILKWLNQRTALSPLGSETGRNTFPFRRLFTHQRRPQIMNDSRGKSKRSKGLSKYTLTLHLLINIFTNTSWQILCQTKQVDHTLPFLPIFFSHCKRHERD